MFRKPVLVSAAALLAAQTAFSTAPAQAQEEHVWSTDRPDAVAPATVFGDRVLPEGVLEIEPAFTNFAFEGTRFGSEFISFEELLEFFDFAPFTLSSNLVTLDLAYGATDRFTLLVRGGYVDNTREVIDDELNVFTLDNEGLVDTEVHGLLEVYGQGAWRGNLQLGVSIPTGSVDDTDDEAGFRTGPLPYDMQTGAGVAGIIPGATIKSQNEAGTVGLQVLGRIYVGENSRGWRPGNAVEARMWAAYRINDFFSVSSGVQALTWNPIVGFDEELVPTRDPGEDPTFFGGERVDIPLGLNLYLTEGILAGNRLSLEFLFNVHEELEGPWLAADDGFRISWSRTF